MFGVFTALALIFSYVEAMIPINFGIPGVKLGLANLIVVIVLYKGDWKDALFIAVARIVLSGFIFGNLFSILYSLAGGLLSLLVMVLLKKTNAFSIAGVSIGGGCCTRAVAVCDCGIDGAAVVFALAGDWLAHSIILFREWFHKCLPFSWISARSCFKRACIFRRGMIV